MNIEKIEVFKGNKIELIEMIITTEDNQLCLFWKTTFKDRIVQLKFFNVSRFRMGEISAPLEIHGFDIINHSQKGWENESKYEICDYEDNRVNFFCEKFELLE